MNKQYTYPHKSRVSITDYLMRHQSYGGWNHPYRGWSPLAWDVKVHEIDETGGWKLKHHEFIDPLLDDEWDDFRRENMDNLWSLIIEDSQRHYIEGEYTTYPGDDQGDWKFTFGGRSGGWLILSKWKNDDFLKMANQESWEDYLNGLFFSDLTILYKAVRCMDVDFTRENAERNVSYQLNFQRTVWEEGIREEARKETVQNPVVALRR